MRWSLSTVLFTSLLASLAAAGDGSTWTDVSGRTMEAEFVRLDRANVVFRKGGQEVEVPISRLSPADRDRVIDLARAARRSGGGDSDADSSGRAKRSGRAKSETRSWTDNQGQQVTARFVGMNGNNVVLSRGNRTINVPFFNFSELDQNYIKGALIEMGQEDKIPTEPPASARSGESAVAGNLPGMMPGRGGMPAMPGGMPRMPAGMPGGMPRMPGTMPTMPGTMPTMPGTPGAAAGAGMAGNMPITPGLGAMPAASPMMPGAPGMAGGMPGGLPGAMPGGPAGAMPAGAPAMPNPGAMAGSMPHMPGMPSASAPSSGLTAGSMPPMAGMPGASAAPSSPFASGMPAGMGSSAGSGFPEPSFPTPPDIQIPTIEFVSECSNCRAEFKQSEAQGKTHCPKCGVAWINQGGKPGTTHNNSNTSGGSFRVNGRGVRGLIKLGLIGVGIVGAIISAAVAKLRGE